MNDVTRMLESRDKYIDTLMPKDETNRIDFEVTEVPLIKEVYAKAWSDAMEKR